jgi:hypothetical protein
VENFEAQDVKPETKKRPMLIQLPDPGYFAAGGVAGVVSRE